MTPLPPPLGSGDLFLWRLDQATLAVTWDSGEGSYRVGGRWSSPGTRAVYAALDPATAILELAVHKTFRALDVVPHVLTAARILGVSSLHVVSSADVPNPHWLNPGIPSAGQQAFDDTLLRDHPMVLILSVVSAHSWNTIFDPTTVGSRFA